MLLIGFLPAVIKPGMDTVIQIRVNPSIEIRLRGDRVRKIVAKNADAEPIIEGIQCADGLDIVIVMTRKPGVKLVYREGLR